MEHHPEAEEKLRARKLRNVAEKARPESRPGALVEMCGPAWPTRTHNRMKALIQEYFS